MQMPQQFGCIMYDASKGKNACNCGFSKGNKIVLESLIIVNKISSHFT